MSTFTYIPKDIQITPVLPDSVSIVVPDILRKDGTEKQAQLAARRQARKKKWQEGPKRDRPGARHGRRHWKRKAATRQRVRDRQWQEEPFDVLLFCDQRKCKRLDRDVWQKWYAPLWAEHDAKHLDVVWPRTAGTKANPRTLFNCSVIHKEKGTILDGPSLELYILSTPTV